MTLSFRRICALFALAAACAVAPCQGQGQGQDSQIKAAFIVNIAMFTSWAPLPEPAKVLVVCASPQHVLWASLRLLDGRSVNGRIWTTVDIATRKECDIDVVSATHASRNAPRLNFGTLCVIDGDTRGKHAGAITLVEEAQLVRFDVDTQQAARAGITFSSRLLRLARNVV